jgi:hypothetical protein
MERNVQFNKRDISNILKSMPKFFYRSEKIFQISSRYILGYLFAAFFVKFRYYEKDPNLRTFFELTK